MKQGRLIRDENSLPAGCHLYVRVPRSRRKLDQVISLLGERQFYYSFHFGGNFLYLSSEDYNKVKHLVTKARIDTTKLLRCW